MRFIEWVFAIRLFAIVAASVALIFSDADADDGLTLAWPIAKSSYSTIMKFSDGPVDCYVKADAISCVKVR